MGNCRSADSFPKTVETHASSMGMAEQPGVWSGVSEDLSASVRFNVNDRPSNNNKNDSSERPEAAAARTPTTLTASSTPAAEALVVVEGVERLTRSKLSRDVSGATAMTASTVIVPAMDQHGNTNLGAEMDRNTMEEMDYEGPTCLQEELNEMLEAVYALISEEDIRAYQGYLEGIQKAQIAERAAKALSPAPDFSLVDQDGERVTLSKLCRKGPVVMQFYRGKWCPHCNAGLMAYNQFLPRIQKMGATFLAISPMLPDGSQFLATKRDLQFAVLSDVGNTVARDYKVTFVVPENIRPTFEAWGHDVAGANGDDLWEVPLAATYIINQKQQIVWSFIDNDHGCWAEPADVADALEMFCGPNADNPTSCRNCNAYTRGKASVPAAKPTKDTFGPDQKSAMDYVAQYPS